MTGSWPLSGFEDCWARSWPVWISRGQIVERSLIEAAVGNGCAHCERGKPIEQIEGRWGGRQIILCLECVLAWWPGKDVAWWEERHSVLADHIAVAIKAAHDREFDELMKSRLGAKARDALGIGG